MDPYRVAKALRKAGIPVKAVSLSDCPDTEDHNVDIDDRISVSVPSTGRYPGLTITVQTADENFLCYPQLYTMKTVGPAIQNILKEV